MLLLLLLGWSKLRYIGELRDSICVLQVSCGGGGGGDRVEGCDGFSSFSLFSTCHVWKVIKPVNIHTLTSKSICKD